MPVPALGGADRGLQDPSPNVLGDAGVQVELVQGLLDPAERTLWNREVAERYEVFGRAS
jgi:hypothetical protein